MARWHRVFPRYDFAGNKGYPTPAHRAALVEFGPCPIHRRSFQPVAQTALAFD
jgi:ribonuclease HII